MKEKLQPAARLRVVRGSEPPPEPFSRGAELLLLTEPPPLDMLYRRYAAYVATIAARLLGRDTELDDLVQDVFVEAVRGIGKLRDPNAVKGWLAKVTVRMAVKRLRRRRWLQALHLEIDPVDYEQLTTPSATGEQRALVAKIYRVLDRLPARTRVIWSLRHVLEESLQSIVELTGWSQSTVQRELREAESLLERELQDE